MNQDTTTHKVGAFQAKNTLGTLLDWVEAGEEVLITRRGRPVARLVSPQAVIASGQRATEAAARICARARGRTQISWAEWKTLRDTGRK